MRPRIPFQRIDVTAAAELVRRDDVLTLDVRDATSYAKAHIAGARHLSQANLSVVITAAAKTRPILIYCYRGHASQEYAQTFSDFGFAEGTNEIIAFRKDGKNHYAWRTGVLAHG